MRSADFAPAGRNRRLLVEGMGLGWKASCSHLRQFPCCALGPKLLKSSLGTFGPNSQSQLDSCAERLLTCWRAGWGWAGTPAAFTCSNVRVANQDKTFLNRH